MLPKKILMISYHTCPLASEEGKETGGMNVYVLELSRELSKLGHQVDVITRSQDPQNALVVPVTKNFRVIHLKAGPQAPIPKRKLINFIPEFVSSFFDFSHQQKINYDLLHCHYYLSGLIGLAINQKLAKKLPLLLNFHTLALIKNLVARSASEQENQARIKAEFNLVKKADLILSPSASEKQYLMYLYQVPKAKIWEIPPGVNTELFRPLDKSVAKKKLGLNNEEKIILFVGRIEPLKGIDVLLYALKILLAQQPRLAIRLLIVGGDISQHITQWSLPLKQLEKLRQTLKLVNYVDFIGQRPQHDLRYFYNAAELVVMPSHYESFGLAAAEAMACGIPVITTNVTGISSLIDERQAHLITTVSNPLLLASQIKKLLTNQKIYQQIRKQTILNVQALKWESVAKKILKLYLRFGKD